MREARQRMVGTSRSVRSGPTARWALAAAAAACAAWLAPAAEAYVGPGAGMGVLGVVLAVVAALLMALVGVVLWPIRMLAHRRKLKAHEREGRSPRADAPRANGRGADAEPHRSGAAREAPTR